MKTITIIGAGMMGSAMSVPARANGHMVRLVGTPLDTEIIDHARKTNRHIKMDRALPVGIEYYQFEEAREALSGCDFVICGVSSFGVDWFIKEALPLINVRLPILMVTKGLHHDGQGGLIPFPHYMREQGKTGHLFCAIGGPCTSYELADKNHSYVAFCGEDEQALLMMREALRTDFYHISLTRDVKGLETAVALKNAYALAVSLAVGLHEKARGEGGVLAYNPQAALFAQSVKEMRGLLALLMGGEENIVFGAGDLYVTVFGGRTRRLGALLGQGDDIHEALAKLSGVTLESVVIAGRTHDALLQLAQQGKANLADFPLLTHIGQLLKGETALDIPWSAFETDYFS